MSNQTVNQARHMLCSICSQLSDYESGLQTVGRENEDVFLPNAANGLKTVKDLNGPGGSMVLLKQCPECGTYYHYKTTYEYLVFGSEDEQVLTRLTDGSSLSPFFSDDSADSPQKAIYGPKPKGFWTSAKPPNFNTQYHFYLASNWYTIKLGFWDYCKQFHSVNETWRFLGCSLSPHNEGLLMYVSYDDENEWCIPMKWTDDRQGAVIDSIDKHIWPTSSLSIKKADFKYLRKPIVQRKWEWRPDEHGRPATTMKICSDKLLWHVEEDHDFKTATIDAEQSFENFIESGPKRTPPDDVLNEMILHFGLSNPTWFKHSK